MHDFDPANNPVVQYTRLVPRGGGGAGRVTFNRTGDRAAVTGWGGTVTLCDFATGRPLIKSPEGGTRLQFSGGDQLAAAVQWQGGRLGIWSVGDGRECRTIVHGRQPSTRPPAVSSDGRLVAANFPERGLVLFDVATGREPATVPFVPTDILGRIGSFQFDGAGNLLTNSMDGCFRWPIRPDPAVRGRTRIGPPERLPLHPSIVGVSASRDGRVVAQSMFNGYGMQQYSGGWILRHGSPDTPYRVLAGSSTDAVAVSPDGRRVAFGVRGGSSRRGCSMPRPAAKSGPRTAVLTAYSLRTAAGLSPTRTATGRTPPTRGHPAPRLAPANSPASPATAGWRFSRRRAARSGSWISRPAGRWLASKTLINTPNGLVSARTALEW